MAPDGPVVVGVDGSQQSVAAASWAVHEAALRHADVHVVLVHDVPARDEQLRAVLQGIVDRLAAQHPKIGMSPEIIHGHPAAELIRLSAQAPVVVVGSRGRGPVTGSLLGSVSTQVATHAHCPVVVVREPRYEGPVLVGVDGSAHSQVALRFAFEAAAERGADLVAMQVWEQTPGVVPLSDERLQQDQDRISRGLAEQLADGARSIRALPLARWRNAVLRCRNSRRPHAMHNWWWSVTAARADSPDCSWDQ